MSAFKKVLISVAVFYAAILVGCFLLVMAYAISTGLTAPDIECGPGEVEIWTGSPECVPEEEEVD